MAGLKYYQRHHTNGCWAAVSSGDRRNAVVDASLRSKISPEIARIEELQDRIAHLKSEFQCIQKRFGSRIFIAQILERLKDMQGPA